MKVKSRSNRKYIKATNLFHFYTNFNVYFFEKLKMHFSKALFYDIIFVI